MSVRLHALVLLLAILWQSLGMLGSFSVSQRAGEFEHLTVHVQDTDHHHHADHSLHMDLDDNGVQHFHADAGSSGNAMPSSTWLHGVDRRTAGLPEDTPSWWLSPTLEGPLRPPQDLS